MKVKIPTHKPEVTAQADKPVVLDLRFRDTAKDPTAPVMIRHGIPTIIAMSRLGDTGWKKVQHHKIVRHIPIGPGTGIQRFEHYHTISKPGTGVVLFMESEAVADATMTVRKITLYAALNYELYKKLNIALPNGNERLVEPRLYADLPRPKQVMLIEAVVTNITEKLLAALDFHMQPGREASGLVLSTWCGKRWGDSMFIPDVIGRQQASVIAKKHKNKAFNVERSIAQQSEELERKLPSWFQEMVSTTEYHAFRTMRIKNPVKAGQPKPRQMNELAEKFPTRVVRPRQPKKEHRAK